LNQELEASGETEKEPEENRFRVTMHKSPGISEEERRRRLHQVYSYLLSLAERKPTDQSKEADQIPPRTSARDTEINDRAREAESLPSFPQERVLHKVDNGQHQVHSHLEKTATVEPEQPRGVLKLDLAGVLRQAIPQVGDDVNRGLLTALLERYEGQSDGLEIIEIDLHKVWHVVLDSAG
jgi:hypothetical protein